MHGRPPIIVAHRGLHHRHVENSLSAFRAAWDAGIDWCECDVWADGDGVPLVIHDETFDRTTAQVGRVDTFRRSVSGELPLLKLPTGAITEERVPELHRLVTARRTAGRLLVEVKPPNARQLVRDAFSVVGPASVIQSFDLANIEHALAIREVGPVAWLIEHGSQLDEVRRCAARAIYADFNLLDVESVTLLRRMKKQIGAWTVNREVDMIRVLALGVDVIITDEPLLARRLASGDNAPKIG